MLRRSSPRAGNDHPEEDRSSSAGRPVQFKITGQTLQSVERRLALLRQLGLSHLFPSRSRRLPYISTWQYARIVHRWVESMGLDGTAYGTQSLRRTKAAHFYRKTGNLRAVQLLPDHPKLESAVRYLGILVDVAPHIAEQLEL